MRATRSSPGRQAVVSTICAFAWSIGLLLAALFAPEYGSATLVQENGSGVLLVVAVPAAVSVAVWFALWRKCSHGARVWGYVAWFCVGVLALFCLLALFSIGLFVVPVALLLARATVLTPSISAPSAD